MVIKSESLTESAPKSSETTSRQQTKSARSYRDVENSKSKEIEMKPRALPDQQKLNKSMSNMMQNFTMHNAKNRVQLYRPSSRTSLTKSPNQLEESKNSLSNLLFNARASTDLKMNPALKAMSRLVAGRHYDVLDNHADRFKAPSKEFVPRIKNTNSSSHLIKKSNYYQPPRRRNKLNPTGSSINLNNEPVNVKESDSFVQKKSDENIDDEIVDVDEEYNNVNVKNDLNRSRLSNKSLNQLNTSHLRP